MSAGGSNAARVAEIFAQAGAAFNKLGELAMSLAAASNGRGSSPGSKWTDDEVAMLRDAVRRFGRDISQLTRVLRNKSVAQIRNQLRRKAFKEAGLNDPGDLKSESAGGEPLEEPGEVPRVERVAPKRPRPPPPRPESPSPAEKRRRLAALEERAGPVAASSGVGPQGQVLGRAAARPVTAAMTQAMRMRLKKEVLEEEEEEDDEEEEEEGIDVEEEDTEPGYDASSLPSSQDRQGLREASDIEEELEEEEEEEEEEELEEEGDDLMVDDDEEEDIDDDENLNI